ncbi:hypothetical protein RN51_00438 [Microbacterium oxydans]|uniref:Uncharacterized protein n=1 Tax=Microbacterium oxydans TaxID=82380 RepID=A0A0F0L346_9MICO|nr:hypothetical protein [Microbacterium oxydans]KJL25931.1 hypothetical protein RN51_00438 [Microbacterium oxydans]
MAIISETISGVLIQIPDDLAAPKTRAAVEHARKAKKARERAFAERDRAADLRWKVDQQIAIEHGALLDEDPDAELPDGGAIVADAQALLEARQRELDARLEAERRAAVKIREAVADELPTLARTSLAEGDTALAMLSAVIEDAGAARDALWSSIGVGRMCARLDDDPGAPIAIQHKAYGYTFDLEAAIEGLNEALTKAGAELAELRGDVKAETGKKTRKPRKTASGAQNAAQTAPAGVSAALGDLTIGEDDD